MAVWETCYPRSIGINFGMRGSKSSVWPRWAGWRSRWNKLGLAQKTRHVRVHAALPGPKLLEAAVSKVNISAGLRRGCDPDHPPIVTWDVMKVTMNVYY